jgi:hypothetical protein
LLLLYLNYMLGISDSRGNSFPHLLFTKFSKYAYCFADKVVVQFVVLMDGVGPLHCLGDIMVNIDLWWSVVSTVGYG